MLQFSHIYEKVKISKMGTINLQNNVLHPLINLILAGDIEISKKN